ncbi:MAG: DUF951 domain-containing protein [Chloroflexi bacterium]|nr:DUF951 domain-containing protein [Chloroflexota bacterium]MCH8816548.1 DUF951 domain-containing protein [Chloroflexota bacterium]
MPGPLRGEPIPYEVGDRITLKKAHPCGANEWRIYRIGADIGLRCGGCGHRVMLPRRQVDRQARSRIPASEAPETPAQG